MMRNPGGACVCGFLILAGVLTPLSSSAIETTVETSTTSLISIRLEFPEPTRLDLSVQGERLTDISMGDIPSTIETGWPKLPCYVAVVGIPADRTVGSVRLDVMRSERLDTAPVRHVDAPSADATAEGYRTPAWLEWPEGQSYPAAPARISGVSWWRNRHVAHIEVFPIRTAPGKPGIDVVREARLIVTLVPARAPSTKPLPAQFGDDPWDAMIESVLQNGPESRAWLRSEAPAPPRRGTSDYFSRSTKWARIEAEGEGILRITGAELANLGLPLPIADASTIRVFVGNPREDSDVPPVFDPTTPDWMREVSIVVEDGGDGDLDASGGDRVELLSVPVDGYLIDIDPEAAGADTVAQYTYYTNHYTSKRVYWLTWDGALSGAPERMPLETVTPSGLPDRTLATVRRRVHLERNAWYDPNPSSADASTPSIWERWWWNLGFSRGDGGILVTFDLPGHVAASPGSFVMRLWGVTDNPRGALPDHMVTVTCNGNALPEVTWDGEQRYDLAVAWDAGQTHLVPGTNQFVVQVNTDPDPGCPPRDCTRVDKSYLAWIDARHEYALAWQGQDLVFRSEPVSGLTRYRITGVPDAAIEVYDVTNPVRPVRLVGGTVTGGTLEFDRTEDAALSHRYLITHPTERKSAAGLRRHLPPGPQYLRERTAPVDYVIVYHEAFGEAAQLLRDLRETVIPGVSDPSVLMVPIEAVFDEFSWGMRDPTAIRNFLKYAYENYRDTGAPTTPRLRYATLIGDASFDHRGRALSINQDFVPAWGNRYDRSLWFGGYTANWPADDYLALFDGRDTSTLFLAVGRLPAQTAAQALDMVRKTRDHFSSADGGGWRSRVAMVADDICQGPCYDSGFVNFTHIRQAENELIPAMPAEMDVRRIYMTEYPDPVTGLECRAADKPSSRDALIEAINEGVWLVDYVGHGGSTQLADEKVLLSSDIPAMQNAGRFHYFMTASCSVGKFDETAEGLGETILKAPQGGAVVSISASAVAGSTDNVDLNEATLKAMFAGDSIHPDSVRTAGEAVVVARAVRGAGGFRLNDTKYNILGDAATTLAWLDRQSELSLAISGSVPALTDTLWRGETMAVSGQVRERDGSPATTFSGSALVEVFDSEVIRHREPFQGVDCDVDRTVVSVFPRDYHLSGAPIYRATVPVQAGVFQSEFLVPLGLRRGLRGDARIRCLATASGASSSLALGTIESVVVPDNPREGWSSDDAQGPAISLTFDGPPLAVPFGSSVRVSFDDPSGINITQLLDSRSVILSFEEPGGFVVSLLDLSRELEFGTDFTTAEIDVPLPTTLAAGRTYHVRVRASDNLGNRGQATEEIFLVGSTSAELQRVFAYPNPSDGQAVGLFVDLNVPAEIEARIYTVSGRLIRTLEATLAAGEGRSRPLVWNLRDEDGDGVANGSYHYVVDVDPHGDEEPERRVGWIAVLR